MHLNILAIGSDKGSLYQPLLSDYFQRILRWKVTLQVFDVKGMQDPKRRHEAESAKLLGALEPGDAGIVLLDMGGKSLTSPGFASFLQDQEMRGLKSLTFVLGGADGVTDALKARAQHVLSFGLPTWPHLLARLLLLEQLYRAQQIIRGHPYHTT